MDDAGVGAAWRTSGDVPDLEDGCPARYSSSTKGPGQVIGSRAPGLRQRREMRRDRRAGGARDHRRGKPRPMKPGRRDAPRLYAKRVRVSAVIDRCHGAHGKTTSRGSGSMSTFGAWRRYDPAVEEVDTSSPARSDTPQQFSRPGVGTGRERTARRPILGASGLFRPWGCLLCTTSSETSDGVAHPAERGTPRRQARTISFLFSIFFPF